MEQWLMKLNSDLGNYICKNWSKVRLDNEYGYFARIGRELGIFVELNYNVYLVGLCGKAPNAKIANKTFNKLIKNEWITPVEDKYYAPFGMDFENRLPFEVDDTVIELGGLINGN